MGKGGTSMKPLFIIVPMFNAEAFLPGFLKTLQQQTHRGFQLILVDDGSTDRTAEIISQQAPDATVVKGDGNWWWTRSVNEGLKQIEGDEGNVLLLNIDLELKPDYLEQLVKASEKYPEALFGSAIYDLDTRKVHDLGWKVNYLTTTAKNNAWSDQKQQGDLIPVQHLSGRGMWIPLSVIRKVGWMNEKNFPQYAADEEYSIRARKQGYELFFSTRAILYSYVAETGLIKFASPPSWVKFRRYLTHFSSPGNLKIRAKIHWYSIPWPFKPLYIVIDSFKTIWRYIKTMRQYKAGGQV